MTMTELFQFLASNVWLYGGTFLLVLSILVFVHEWGHYIVAKLCGVKIETFSIGFGKELFGWNDKHGTRWKFSLVPLGGYVKMFGDTDPASAGSTDQVGEGESARSMTEDERAGAFFAKPVWQRMAIVFAGPGINFLFAVFLFAVLFATHGQPVTPPIAGGIIENSGAETSGIVPGDVVLKINGRDIQRFEDIRREVMIALDTPMDMLVERDGEVLELVATAERRESRDKFGFKQTSGFLGLVPPSGLALESITAINGQAVSGPDEARDILLQSMGQVLLINRSGDPRYSGLTVRPTLEGNEGLSDPDSEMYKVLIISNEGSEAVIKYSPIGAISGAIRETINVTGSTLTALGQMVTGTRPATEMGGIIRIGAIAGDMATLGFLALVSFTALLSINLGLINLFPIPMLDGGHLVFYTIEALRGAPLSERIQEYAFRMGLALLVCLMLFANLNDLVQILTS